MSDLPSLDLNDFAQFFRAVHGHDPFPWQDRLARQVAATGWPSVLDLPTGTGKTAALDVAVFALALEAGRTPRAAPLRIIYVVDRRTIVDQAYDRAKKIHEALAKARDGILTQVRERLARYTNDAGAPLRIALLRGGIARDEMWARTPDQPLIVVSTVDQVGSRLLFRGYGVSDLMKPIHAGLLGCDVLYLLDEVHLSQPFRETLTAIRSRYRAWAEQPLTSPFTVVEMSATPGSVAEDAFRLEDDDRRHPRLSERLQSSKPASLVSTNAKGFLKEIERHVLSMLDRPGATLAVVVNRVKSARDLHKRLSEVVPNGSSSVHLLTGRMRPFERDMLEGSLLERIRAGRTRSPDDPPAIVVATQSIEAGADFDFDGLVTECASLDALRQRFGRLDRLGELADSARGVIVARSDSLKDDPVYGNAIGKTWDWLQAAASDQIVDFGISALVVPGDADEQGLLAPKAHAPILLPAHLDAWVQTSPIPDPDPDVALWLHGPQRGLPDIQIVWRADLTETLLSLAVDDARAEDIAIGIVEALPPVSAEAMSVAFLAAKRWLERQPEPDSFDVEGALDVEGPDANAEGAEAPRAVLVWQGEQSRVIHATDLRPGQTIVLPASYGGIDHFNWAPDSLRPVDDIAELAALAYRRQPVLRLHTAVVRGWLDVEVDAPQPEASDSEALDDRGRVLAWIESKTPGRTGKLRQLFDWLLEDAKSLRVDRVSFASSADAHEYFLVTGKRRPPRMDQDVPVDSAVIESSTSSFTGVEVTLADHLAGVAETVSGFAARVGLSGSFIADLRLAGEWHDGGKADVRFQRWLHGGSELKALVQPLPLAKSTARLPSRAAIRRARERAGYPAGGRHELMSMALMESAGDWLMSRTADWVLVQHIVTSHHGYCRPLAPYVSDSSPVDVTFRRDGIVCKGSSAHDLARLDSGIADRFWQVVRRYGWWGSAWLETLLRLADQRQSEREQKVKSKAK